MSKKALNLIIIISLISIVCILIIKQALKINSFFNTVRTNHHQQSYSQNNNNSENNTTPTQPITTKIICNSKFFNTTPNTARKYQIILYKYDKSLFVKNKLNFETKVLAASGSSIFLETTINNDNKPVSSTLICTNQGIKGFPFALKKIVNQIINKQSGIDKYFDENVDFIFIPDDKKIIPGTTWSNIISLIPGYLDFEMITKVTANKTSLYYDSDYKLAYNLETALVIPKSIQQTESTVNIKFNTQIAEDIGITQLDLKADNQIIATLKLIDYKSRAKKNSYNM